MDTKVLTGQVDRSYLTAHQQRVDGDQLAALIRELKQVVESSQILDDYDQRLAFSYDATGERCVPDVVVFATGSEEVQQVVTMCARHHVYLIARGSSSNLSGGTTPVLGGLILVLTRQRRILDLDTVSRVAEVEPGVINADLQQALSAHGFFYPPDPASHKISTLGGNVAENSGGPHCIKYGVTTNHVVCLQVVLGDGSLLWTPTARDFRTGLDFTGILTGSEGTMAVITRIVLDIWPKPETTQTMLAVFASPEQALEAVQAIISGQVVPSTLELLDKKSLQLVESFVHAGYPVDAGAVLLIEVDGDSAEISAQVGKIRAILSQQGVQELKIAATDLEADAFWRGRRAHYGAAARLAPHLWIQDVTVPRPLLADMMNDVLNIGREFGFDIFCAAHAGDGNLHPIITYDPADADELRRMKQADRAILRACVARGGAITGEHGIGLDKIENLELMYGNKERSVMANIKRAFDPEGLFNPLKVVFPPSGSPADSPPPKELPNRVHNWNPGNLEQLRDAVVQARQDGLRLSIGGGFQRWRLVGGAPDTPLIISALNGVMDYDRDNLTIEVQAGMQGKQLLQLLRADGLDIPFLPSSGNDTVGGLIASNARHWRHSFLLGWRDVVLGLEWVDGLGDSMHFGRKTMKNVAGYDVAKLAIGSWGTLGVISRVILRLRPYPARRLWGYVMNPQIQPLLELGVQMSHHPNRPEGMVLTRWNNEQPRLWMAHQAGGVSVTQQTVESLCGQNGLDVHWSDDDIEPWREWEETRQKLQDESLRHGSWGEGGTKTAQLTDVVKEIEAVPDLSAIIYPGSGAYELYSSQCTLPVVPGLTRGVSRDGYWQEPVESAWQKITSRLEKVFDPHGIFSKIVKE